MSLTRRNEGRNEVRSEGRNDLYFTLLDETIPLFYLVFFFIGTTHVTKTKFVLKKELVLEKTEYFDVENDLCRTKPLTEIKCKTCAVHFINGKNKWTVLVDCENRDPTHSALCVDFLVPTNKMWGVEKNKIFASTTIFEKNKQYHLLDMAVAGKQDLCDLNTTWEFNSYGYFVSNRTYCTNKIPMCEIQTEFLKTIQEYLDTLPSFDCCGNQHVESVHLVPFHLNNRMFFAIPPYQYLKHVKIPRKPMFGPLDPTHTLEQRITAVVNKGYQWIYNHKSFSREFHGATLISAWKSLFQQDCGNCLDMAITMYQIVV